jgi:SPX domain protein involved in polyphosphate accumulation
MKAMADAGYTYDFEKKELKKVEQKPAWSEEDENRFKNLIMLVNCSKENEPTKKGFINFINKLKSLRPQSKQEWSEEDEANLNEALSYIKDNDLREFIKSLKPKSCEKIIKVNK